MVSEQDIFELRDSLSLIIREKLESNDIWISFDRRNEFINTVIVETLETGYLRNLIEALGNPYRWNTVIFEDLLRDYTNFYDEFPDD